MCGIHAVITTRQGAQLPATLRQALSDRGPDYTGELSRFVVLADAPSSPISLTFTSTVLALRGDHVAKQPLEIPTSDSVLCWNGEAWKVAGERVAGNDSEAILARLAAITGTATMDRRQTDILEVFRDIQGPFALVYYDAPGKCLYYGRDRLGRRSLLENQSKNADVLAFSSIADSSSPEWREVAADGIYSISFETTAMTSLVSQKHDWVVSGGAALVSSIGRFNMSLPTQPQALNFTSPSVELLHQHLTEALKLRVLNVPKPPSTPGYESSVDVRVAVLFSGGLDCTVMARLVHEILPPTQGIDLINVAFQNARNAAKSDLSDCVFGVYEACPDRITGRKAFEELQRTCASRHWRFIAINVPFTEAMAHRPRVISLMYPHNTEMDLSISWALYFASRGIGYEYSDAAEPSSLAFMVTTPARVLLSGLGADELFGGYSRHEVAFKRGGYAALNEELMLDVSRIGTRNLGRDDRILSCWGKEVRFPFLDEDFIRFAIESPVWEKCDFENQSHESNIDPAKRVLRLLADRLGLPSTAREKKRAIQFGARTAKIEQRTGGPKTKGTDVVS